MSHDRKKTRPKDEDKFERRRRRLAERSEREAEDLPRAKLHELERRACEEIIDDLAEEE